MQGMGDPQVKPNWACTGEDDFIPLTGQIHGLCDVEIQLCQLSFAGFAI